MEENSTNTTPLNYKFLTNKAVGKDLFNNQSQDKIAQVISDQVINEKDFKIIGIDGTWGSGKSNLVYQIQTKLEQTHSFFIYDVWGHQEDEQRKAILVEFTEFIKSQPNLLKKAKKESWDNNLKSLLANRKETTTINQPYLSVGFIFSLLSIVYIPSVNVFKDGLVEYFNIKSVWGKVFLVLTPILIVVFIYLYNYFKNLFCEGKGFLKSFRISAEETFQVYTNKQKEETKIETISENQPSVRDFQKWMKDIDDDLTRKVVIVFDNFDRLPKKHILNIWSSIHIFFAEKEYENIKVILPFDREHVQNAFSDFNGRDVGQSFGDDYINKTFDIVFRVTLPIMSDWKQFFTDQWESAVTINDPDELQLVIQVYEFLSRRTTPREIITFINEILTIKLLDIEFKERYIAIFVLKKSDILKQPLSSITNLEYLGGIKSIYENDHDFARQLTAIIYHIEVENAVEIIYSQQLRDALNKYEVEIFNNICESNFANSIFSRTISEIDVFENPIKTLAEIKDNAKVERLHISQAWKSFYYKAVASYVNKDRLEIEDWQLILLQNYEDDHYLKLLLDNFAEINNEINTLVYVGLIDTMFNHLTEERVLKYLKAKNITGENFINLVELKGQDYKKYNLLITSEQLDSHLISLDIDDLRKIKNSGILASNFDLPNYKSRLKEVLKDDVQLGDLIKISNTLSKLKESGTENNVELKEVLSDGDIYRLYANSSTSTALVNEAIAMRIGRGLAYESTYSSSFDEVLLKEDENSAKSIATTILNYISYGDLLLNAQYFKTSPLYKAVILQLFSLNNAMELDVSEVITNYDKIKVSLTLSDSILLTELDRWEIEKRDFNLDKLGDEFISDCFHTQESSTAKVFNEKFNEEFKNLDREGLNEVFQKSNGIHWRFFNYLNPDSLTQASFDSFGEAFISKIETKGVSVSYWPIFAKYEANNEKLPVENLLKDIRDKFLNGHVELNADVAHMILPYFIKYNVLDTSSDVFRTILKNNFLNDPKIVSLLLSKNEYIRNVYQNSSAKERGGFKNTINELRENSEEIEELAKKLGIRKTAKEQE